MRTRHAVAAATVSAALLVGGAVAVAAAPHARTPAERADASETLWRLETIVAVAGHKLLDPSPGTRVIRLLPRRMAHPAHPASPANRSKDRLPAR